MKASEIKQKTKQEIIDELNNLYKELLHLRLRRASRELPNPLRLRSIRRDIARLRTILRENELGKIKLLEAKVVKQKAKKGEKDA